MIDDEDVIDQDKSRELISYVEDSLKKGIRPSFREVQKIVQQDMKALMMYFLSGPPDVCHTFVDNGGDLFVGLNDLLVTYNLTVSRKTPLPNVDDNREGAANYRKWKDLLIAAIYKQKYPPDSDVSVSQSTVNKRHARIRKDGSLMRETSDGHIKISVRTFYSHIESARTQIQKDVIKEKGI